MVMPLLVPPPRFCVLTSPWFYWPVLLCAFGALILAVGLNGTPRVPPFSDFPTLYSSAVAARTGHNLYSPYLYGHYFETVQLIQDKNIPAAANPNHNLNPPAAILLMTPLAFLPLRTAYYVNCGLQFILALLVLLRVLPHFRLSGRASTVLSVAAFCLYYPVFANFYVGQVGLYLFILLGLGWLALRRGALRQAGLWLGLALTYKLFVGLLFIWLLLQRRWLVLWYGALVWCVLQCLALWLFGPQAITDWLTVVATYTGQTISWNLSIYGPLHRYFGAGLLQPLYDLPYLRWAILSSALVFAAVCLLWLNRQGARLPAPVVQDLGYALCIPLMLLLSPVGWLYYYAALLLSAGLIYRHSSTAKGLLCGGLISSALPLMLSIGNAFSPDPWQNYLIQLESLRGLIKDPNSLERFAPYVVPELSMLALILLPLAAVYTAYKLRSAQIGA
jgi:hypothetical protein